ncbi:MAG: (2Fe-2S) ferredoxin domain-containing protein [Erysipelotrichaceae bacterium]|jgi:NADH-quinone oxidoreductase subunit G|nr:(2Fe-2S) ferredoxin domain-containing protein [Erysipelotrichaceae bacterium]MBR3167672.1 (2Fe-2S) ferredoxin domain-containing protein [Erysipelotrichaceae bacterium]
MLKIEVCIGSACYVKGSNQVVADLSQMIRDEGWEDKISLTGSFCMKACQNKTGLGIRINGELIPGITMQNAKEALKAAITERLA